MMKNHLNKIYSFTFAVILTASSVLAGMPATTTFAASAQYAVEIVPRSGQKVNEVLVKEALEAIRKVRETGSGEDYIKACNLIAILRPIDKLRLYAELTGNYYLANYKNAGFRFFDAERYLAVNEDVRIDALRYSPDDIYSYAVNHYIEYGIAKGRSSGTSFDPMVAILVKPEILYDIILASDNTVSDTLYESFVQKTGKTTTDKYTVLPDSLIVIGIDGINVEDSSDDDSAPVSFPLVSESIGTVSKSTGSNSPESPDAEEQQEVQKEYRERKYINNLARDITPYTLYKDSFDTELLTFTSYNPFEDINNNKNVNVTFYGGNYRRAKELSEGKKYTLMLYCCGTNLERSADYRRVSGEIVSMLQADMSNVNVILCVGGTETYGNGFLNDPEYGASGLRAGIYYLNPDGLSDNVKGSIGDINTDDSDTILQLGGDNSGSDLTHGLRFDDIFTADSLIPIVNTSAVDMADPSFLAGFINLSTNLFPADNYGLTLSDHGGGLEGGVIFTDSNEEIEANGIYVYQLESALASTDLYRDKDVSADGKLGVIFYSACCMGSTELAYLTKDYYRYMIASEESTSGHDSYRYIISGLNYQVGIDANDCSIAKDIAMSFENNTAAHHGYNDYYVGSIAVFSSEDMDNMREKINEFAVEFSEILGTDHYSEDMKNDVFIAIRKAALSCYPTCGASVSHTYYEHLINTSYVDIGELLTHVKKNLDDVYQNGYETYDSSDKSEFDRLREKLDDVLETGFLVYLSMYKTEMGGISATGSGNETIPLNYTMNSPGNIWTDIRTDGGFRDYLYGSSIYLPLLKDPESFKNESEYYKYFVDSDLNDYAVFVENYLIYLNNGTAETGYKARIDSLRQELNNISLERLISQVESDDNVLITLRDGEESRNYISFKIADSYEEGNAPENTLGSPMLDILETYPSIMLAAVHKQRFEAKRNNEDGFLEVNMICAEQPVPSFSFALDSNTISFDVTDETRSIISAITMEGKAFGSDSDYDWQFVLRSHMDSEEDDKLNILQQIFPEVENVSDVNTILISGKYKPEEGENKECYHVFKVKEDDEYQYSYKGSVLSVTDEAGNESFQKAEGVIGVSAYHYVLKEEKDESGETKYTKAVLEELECVEDGFFTVTDQDHELVLKKGIYVTQQEGDNIEYTGKATAYCIAPSAGVLSADYSGLGYVSERTFNTGSITMGNGPLGTIEYDDDAAVAGIGTFGTEGPEGDTERPDETNEDEPVNSAVKDSGNAIEVTPVENNAGDAVESALVENNAGAAIESAFVEASREDAEAKASSPEGDTDRPDESRDEEEPDTSEAKDSGNVEASSVENNADDTLEPSSVETHQEDVESEALSSEDDDGNNTDGGGNGD